MPALERVLRILISAAVLVYALVALAGPWRPIAAAGAVGFALTGVLGFCPACAMVGRRLKTRT